MENFPTPVCNRCGSKLIEVKRKVEKSATLQSPVTTTSYKCSNKDCQREIEKKMAELAQKRKDLEAQQAARQAEKEQAQALLQAQKAANPRQISKKKK